MLYEEWVYYGLPPNAVLDGFTGLLGGFACVCGCAVCYSTVAGSTPFDDSTYVGLVVDAALVVLCRSTVAVEVTGFIFVS